MNKIQLTKLFLSVALCLSAGIVGSLFTFSAIPTWYAHLQKPSFSPPNWVFGPVWTTLYVLMAISFYIIWTSKKKKQSTLTIFFIQLGLNALWSIIFFGLKNPLVAFIEIGMLWISILVTIWVFYHISKTAAYLLLPYIAWVTFAGVLNALIVQLN